LIVFLLLEEEGDREEKRRFFQSQVRLLQSVGMDARVFECSGADMALPARGCLVVFDVSNRARLRAALDRAGVAQAPMVWNPYSFLGPGHDWVRSSERIVAVLVPGKYWGQKLRYYRLTKPIVIVAVAADLNELRPPHESASWGRIRRVGYFSAGAKYLSHIRGVLTRCRQDLGDLRWIEMTYENPEEWRKAAADCDAFMSMRGVSGSAIPLLDLMASRVVVGGLHGGGLRGIATPDNGIWVNSSTIDRIAAEFADGLTRLREEPAEHRRLVENARRTALACDADAVFEQNLTVWKRLCEMVAARL